MGRSSWSLRRENRLSLKTAHRRFNALQQQYGQRFSGSRKNGVVVDPLRLLQGGEDIVRGIHSLRWPSNSNLESNEAIPTHCFNDRTNSLVTAIASSLPKTTLARGDIEVIVNNDEIFQGDAEG